MQIHASLFLDRRETITADDKLGGGGHCTIRFGSVSIHFDSDQLPARIDQLQAAALALRDVVDDVIADEKAQQVDTPDPSPPEPDWETVTIADLTVGRRIRRADVDPVGCWRQVTGIAPHPHLPGVVLLDLDGDQVATVSDRDAVRAVVVVETVEDEPVGVDAGAVA